MLHNKDIIIFENTLSMDFGNCDHVAVATVEMCLEHAPPECSRSMLHAAGAGILIQLAKPASARHYAATAGERHILCYK